MTGSHLPIAGRAWEQFTSRRQTEWCFVRASTVHVECLRQLDTNLNVFLLLLMTCSPQTFPSRHPNPILSNLVERDIAPVSGPVEDASIEESWRSGSTITKATLRWIHREHDVQIAHDLHKHMRYVELFHLLTCIVNHL